jgi:hypothetical protein
MRRAPLDRSLARYGGVEGGLWVNGREMCWRRFAAGGGECEGCIRGVRGRTQFPGRDTGLLGVK